MELRVGRKYRLGRKLGSGTSAGPLRGRRGRGHTAGASRSETRSLNGAAPAGIVGLCAVAGVVRLRGGARGGDSLADKAPPLRLDAGAFGDIYLGVHVLSGENVAIKLEPLDSRHQQLVYEAKIYKLLEGGGACGAPGITLVLGNESLHTARTVRSPRPPGPWLHSGHPPDSLVRRGGRLQRHDHRPAGPQPGGLVQLLQPALLAQDGVHARRAANLPRPVHARARLCPPRHQGAR